MPYEIIGMNELTPINRFRVWNVARSNSSVIHIIYPVQCTWHAEKGKKTMSIGYSSLSLVFFSRYAYQALFLFFANFGFCRFGCRCLVYSIFGNSRAVSFWCVSPAQSQHRRRIVRQLADPSARPSLIVAAAKLETAGTRGRWPGLTSRVSRL